MSQPIPITLPDLMLVSDAQDAVSPYTRPSLDILIDAVNAATGMTFSTTDFDLDPPRMIIDSQFALELLNALPVNIADAPTSWLTSLTLKAKPSLSFTGQFHLVYRRMGLGAFPPFNAPAVLPDSLLYLAGDVSIDDASLIAAINARLQINLTAEEVSINRSVSLPNGDTGLQIQILPTSLLWAGSFYVDMVASNHLGLVIQDIVLDGLHYPFDANVQATPLVSVSYTSSGVLSPPTST